MNENETTTTTAKQRRANKKRWFARLSLLGTRAERASTNALVMAGPYTSNRAMARAAGARS